MAITPQQHTADFLSASGYEPETILSYLEEAAAAGKLEADGQIRIGNTIYDWADNPGRPALYEFDRVTTADEERSPRVKTWRAINRGKLRSRLRGDRFRVVGMRGNVNTDSDGASGGEISPPAPQG